MSLVKIQPYITDNVANFTFGGLTITANAVFGNTNLGNISTANFFTVSSNITSGNASLGNLAVANYFSGNGSLLTGIIASTATSLVSGTSNIKLASSGNANISIGGTSNVVVITTTGVNIAGYLNATNVIGEGGNLSNIQGSNISGTVSSATTAGTVTTASQPNITSVGLLTGLSVQGISSFIGNTGVVGNFNISGGNANISGNLTANNITTGGNISGANNISANSFTAITGITGNGTINFTNASNVSLGPVSNVKVTGGSSGQYLQTDGSGNLSWVTLTISTSSISNGNSNVSIPSNGNVNISAVGNSNVLVVTGTGVNIAGTLNATGTLTAGNLVTSGTGGNISGANNISANTFTGTLTTNAQTNITSVGTLTTLAITGTGNISGANLVSANYFTGTLTTAAQPNITSLGALTGLTINGDAILTGNLTVSGNFEYANVTTFRVKDPVIELGGNTSGTALTTNDGYDRGTVLHYYSGGAVDAFMGWKNSSQEFIFASNTTESVGVMTVNSYGNVRANYFIGNGSQLTGLSTITVANANYSNFAGTVINASQPNITSLGTLTSLTVTGNITAGNVAGGNLVNATYISGNGSLLTSLTGTNVVGNVPYAGTSNYANTANSITGTNVSGNVNYAITSNWANIANSVSGTNVSGNVSYAITSNYANTANAVAGANVSGNVSYAITSNYANTANAVTGSNVSGQVGNALLAGTVYTNAQPNITSVGSLTGLTLTSNSNITLSGTLSQVSGANLVSGTYLTGTLTTAAQPNITSVGTLTSLSITGNLTAGNANLGNSVVANFFTGSGAGLTSVIAVTAGTVTTNAQPAITSVGTLTSLIVGNNTANTTFGNGTITASGNISFTGSNVSLGSITNLKITGGTAGYFMTTDGAGNLSWGATSGGGGVSASGSDTQIQFNDGGVLGATSNLTFNKTSKILTVDRIVNINGANLGSNVSNVYIGGGSTNQILKTDGAGNLSWIAQPVATITVDNYTGDGTTTAYTLSVTPTSINQTIVNYNGIFQLRTSAYTLSGATLTFTEAPLNGSKIEITTTLGAMSGAGAFVTRSYTGTGSQTAYTVTSGCTVNSVIVTENGLVQTPTTDYTISGSTLTFATAPANGVVIQIRELAIAVATATVAPITIKDEGSNLTTSLASIDFVGTGVTATTSGNDVTVTISGGSGGVSNARVTGYNLVFGG
jgi:hypothetical protein